MANTYSHRDVPFSHILDEWLTSHHPKTLAHLSNVFAEKSFAIAFLLLMALPASPLPTGGLSHVFEAISMLLAVELIVGRRTLWLPGHWTSITLSKTMLHRAAPFLIRVIRWCEGFSKPRLGFLMQSRLGRSVLGFLILIFSCIAFIAPPFSDLDILPSLGVVIIALSLILSDVIVLIVGILVGTLGFVVLVGLGALFLEVVRSLIVLN